MTTLAIFGLGSMGFGSATSLLAAGHDTYGFDPVAAAQERFLVAGGRTAPLAEIADSLDCAVVVADPQVEILPSLAARKSFRLRCVEKRLHS
ncbi:MAG: NAD(P)-binding domain-containing protein, partial [Pseudomonadota bacterium]